MSELPEPVFVRSTANYPAYTDFWRLVELSGFPQVPAADAALNRDGLYIWPTMDMEFIERLSREPRGARAARVIFWNIERPDEKPGVDARELFQKGMGEILEWADAIWVSDRGVSRLDPRTIQAVLGGHEGLREQDQAPAFRYDVAHLGTLTPRRKELLARLEEQGLRVSPNAWGAERAEILASSKLLLGVDRVEGFHIQSPLRWAIAAAYGLPIVNEGVGDPYPLEAGKSVLVAPYEQLEETILWALKSPERELIALRGAIKLCWEWTFRKGVEEALGRTPCARRQNA